MLMVGLKKQNATLNVYVLRFLSAQNAERPQIAAGGLVFYK
jgi:hypothetical protein